jgi:hypothetical protein
MLQENKYRKVAKNAKGWCCRTDCQSVNIAERAFLDANGSASYSGKEEIKFCVYPQLNLQYKTFYWFFAIVKIELM